MVDIKNELGSVHVYAQSRWHDEAFIVGDVTALTRLRDALNAALEAGRGSALVMAADGEGYRLHVVRHETARMDRMRLPYSEFSRVVLGHDPKGRYPSSLVSHHREGGEEDEILDDDEWFAAQRKFGLEYE